MFNKIISRLMPPASVFFVSVMVISLLISFGILSAHFETDVSCYVYSTRERLTVHSHEDRESEMKILSETFHSETIPTLLLPLLCVGTPI